MTIFRRISIAVLLASLALSGCVAHELQANKDYKQGEKVVNETVSGIFDRLDNQKEGN